MPLKTPPPFKLTPERKRVLEETLKAIGVMEERLQQMRDANLDVSIHEEKMRDMRAKTEGILRVFG